MSCTKFPPPPAQASAVETTAPPKMHHREGSPDKVHPYSGVKGTDLLQRCSTKKEALTRFTFLGQWNEGIRSFPPEDSPTEKANLTEFTP
jgi:hypothetical protein